MKEKMVGQVKLIYFSDPTFHIHFDLQICIDQAISNKISSFAPT